MKVQINAAVYTDKSAITQKCLKQTVGFFGSLLKGNDAASGKLWPGPSSTPSSRGCFKTFPCNCRMGWSRTRSASRLRRASPLTHSLTKFATFHDDQFASVMCFFQPSIRFTRNITLYAIHIECLFAHENKCVSELY